MLSTDEMCKYVWDHSVYNFYQLGYHLNGVFSDSENPTYDVISNLSDNSNPI
jgi:hypothetical protein